MNTPLREDIQHAGNGLKQSIAEFFSSKGLPFEARHYLSDWIKHRILPCNLSASKPNDEKEIEAIYEEFMGELNNAAETSRDPFARYKLWSAQQKFKVLSPAVLYQTLKDGVEEERPLRKDAQAQSGTQVIVFSHMNSTMAAKEVAVLATKSLEFRRRTDQLASMLARFRIDDKANYERSVACHMNSNATTTNGVSGPKKSKHQFTTVIDTLELQMQTLKGQLETCLSEYLSYIQDTVRECSILIDKVVEKLLPTIRWHCWELNDVIPSMTDVQQWYLRLIEICFDLKQSLGTMQQKDIPWNFQSLWYDRITRSFHELTNCHNSLLANPIALSSQPADTVRTTKMSSIKVKLLCGNKLFAPEAMPQMKVILINENQAQRVHQFGFPNGIQKDKTDGKREPFETCGTLTGNTAACSSTGTWSFEKLSVKAVQRKKPSHNESVLEEKFCFLVHTTTPLEHNKMWWCCSRPFFVTVNNSQNSKVTALAFIEESFCSRNRKPFQVPESVPCSKVITALEKYFMRRTNSQRGFTPMNKAFLRSKLLKRVEAESDKDPVVNLKRLSENEEGCSFTFFNWFTGIIDVVNLHLKAHWEEGYIIGFIDRLKTEEHLKKIADDGSFIVRFSESKLNSITLSYVLKIGDESVTASLAPFTSEQLKSLSLPEILQGRIYHGQLKRSFTKVYFYEVSEGSESLKWEHKSVAFPPLVNIEKAEKQNPVGYVKVNVVLAIANPEES